MTLSFNIEYRTSWGEEIRVLGSVPELGGNRMEDAVSLTTVDGIHWTAEIEIQMPEDGSVQYCYHVYREGKSVRAEWNSLPRVLHVSGATAEKYIICTTVGRICPNNCIFIHPHLPNLCWLIKNVRRQWWTTDAAF